MASAKRVANHETIRHWIEEAEGQLLAVDGHGAKSGGEIWRVGFPPDTGEESLRSSLWDQALACIAAKES